MPPSFLQAHYGPLTVSYTSDLDGGGNTFGRAYEPFVRAHFGRVGSVFEWCAGPGFIGFSLLAADLCDTLDLGDVNPEAGAVVEQTIRANNLRGRAGFHLSDGFAAVPGDRRWDLVVGNPPHVNAAVASSEYQRSHSPLIWRDTAWAIHRRFYAAAAQRLLPGGAVVVQENHRFSVPEDFAPMITASGLETVGAFPCGAGYEDYYFLWSRLPERRSSGEPRSGDTTPLHDGGTPCTPTAAPAPGAPDCSRRGPRETAGADHTDVRRPAARPTAPDERKRGNR